MNGRIWIEPRNTFLSYSSGESDYIMSSTTIFYIFLLLFIVGTLLFIGFQPLISDAFAEEYTQEEIDDICTRSLDGLWCFGKDGELYAVIDISGITPQEPIENVIYVDDETEKLEINRFDSVPANLDGVCPDEFPRYWENTATCFKVGHLIFPIDLTNSIFDESDQYTFTDTLSYPIDLLDLAHIQTNWKFADCHPDCEDKFILNFGNEQFDPKSTGEMMARSILIVDAITEMEYVPPVWNNDGTIVAINQLDGGWKKYSCENYDIMTCNPESAANPKPFLQYLLVIGIISVQLTLIVMYGIPDPKEVEN